jgi:hypothetical protein
MRVRSNLALLTCGAIAGASVLLGACGGARGGSEREVQRGVKQAAKQAVREVATQGGLAEAQPTEPSRAEVSEAAAAPATTPETTPTATPTTIPATTPIVLSPHVRVDRERGFVEVDGTIAVNVHGATPKVYLEVLVTTRNTREHEALVVTDAKPEDVHAGLLLLGLQPGTPASFAWTPAVGDEPARLVGTPARGDAVRVLVQRAGSEAWVPLVSWMRSERGAEAVRDAFVFAGSAFRRVGGREVYAATLEGTIVGLTAFGSETVAYGPLHNPEAASEQPHFLATSTLPPQGDSVVVRLVAGDTPVTVRSDRP